MVCGETQMIDSLFSQIISKSCSFSSETEFKSKISIHSLSKILNLTFVFLFPNALLPFPISVFYVLNLKFYMKYQQVIFKWAAIWQNQQMNCAPSEDSDQPGHPPSLIRVFTVGMKKAWVLSYPMRGSEDSDQTGRMPRLIWVFTGHTLILLVLSCRGSNISLS